MVNKYQSVISQYVFSLQSDGICVHEYRCRHANVYSLLTPCSRIVDLRTSLNYGEQNGHALMKEEKKKTNLNPNNIFLQ